MINTPNSPGQNLSICPDFHGNWSWLFTAGACGLIKLKFSAWLHWSEIFGGVGSLEDHLPHSWAEAADKKGLIFYESGFFFFFFLRLSVRRHASYLLHSLCDASRYPSHLRRWRGLHFVLSTTGCQNSWPRLLHYLQEGLKAKVWVHQESYQLSPLLLHQRPGCHVDWNNQVAGFLWEPDPQLLHGAKASGLGEGKKGVGVCKGGLGYVPWPSES